MTKGDLISRQAVLEIVNNPLNIRLDEIIKKLPSVKPQEPKTGHWIESKQRSKHWYCSVCGGIHTDPETGKWRETFDYRYPFCPNCGADMRGYPNPIRQRG